MVRPLTFVPVGKEQHQPGRLTPSVFSSGNEPVDDHLRAIHEVSELRLPKDEGFLVRYGVPVF